MLEKLSQLIKTAQQQSEGGKYNFDELEEHDEKAWWKGLTLENIV